MSRYLEKLSDRYISLLLACLIVTVIVIIFLPSIWLSIDQVTRSGEEHSTEVEVQHAGTILRSEINRLDQYLLDWSSWDDTYQFAQDTNEAYIESNLADETLENLDLDIFLVLDPAGKPVYVRCADRLTQASDSQPFDAKKLLRDYPTLAKQPLLSLGQRGLASVAGEPAMAAARPILTSMGQGPPAGVLIWIRLIDSKEMDDLSHLALRRIDLLFPGEQPDLPPAEALNGSTYISVRDTKTTLGYRYLADLNGEPALILAVENPRALYALGRDTALIFSAMLLLLCALLGGGSYYASLNLLRSRRAGRQYLQRFQSIVQNTREAILLVSSNGQILEANPAGQELLAWRPDPAKPAWLKSLFTFEPDLDENLVRRISGSGEVSLHRCVRHDGLILTLELSAGLVSNGEPRAYSLIMHDVTAHQQAIQSLRASEERYMLAANGSNDGLWDWNLTTGTMYYSSRWKAILGYSSEEISTAPEEWFRRVHPDDRHLLQTALSDHLSQRSENFRCEHRLLHKDGEYRWVLARGVAVWNTDGAAYRMAGSLSDVSERKKLEEMLRHDALHDPLTGLANRSLLLDRLRQANERKKRKPDLSFALFFLDFDRFKQVNDSLGHQVGDLLLVEVSRRLGESLRVTDTISRYTGSETLARIAGDEFVILIEDFKSSEDIHKVAQRISQILSAPYAVNGHEITLTASIGLVIPETYYQNPEDIIRDADIAMYRAKQLGGAQVVLFAPEMYTQILARVEMENDLRKALEHGEFEVFYQPIYALTDNRITGFEALVRWNHPQKGLIMPSEFIQSAEEIGVIIPLGYFVLEEACRKMQFWRERYQAGRGLMVSVNFSARQILHEGLVENIRVILDRTGFDPKMLWLEVTESTLLARNPRVFTHLNELRAMGIRIEIDDFGTGYSAFSYLHTLPVDGFKIDRSFISDIQQGGQQIIKSLLEMGQHLGLTQVAEGVETEQQREYLKCLACSYAQGYLMSRPIQAGAVEELLKGLEDQ